MRPKQHAVTGSGDLFRARLDQIINMKHELVQLAGKIDWAWLGGGIAPLYSDNGRPGPREGRYHCSAQGHHVSDRCQAAACRDPRAQPPGQKTWSAAAAVL